MESATDITPECLTLFCVAEPKPGMCGAADETVWFTCSSELIVVGTGAHLCSALPVVRQLLSSRGISLEVQDTVSIPIRMI